MPILLYFKIYTCTHYHPLDRECHRRSTSPNFTVILLHTIPMYLHIIDQGTYCRAYATNGWKNAKLRISVGPVSIHVSGPLLALIYSPASVLGFPAGLLAAAPVYEFHHGSYNISWGQKQKKELHIFLWGGWGHGPWHGHLSPFKNVRLHACLITSFLISVPFLPGGWKKNTIY